MQDQREWLSPKSLADEFDVPEKTVYVWNSKGTGPRYVRIGKHVRYRRSDVETWLDGHYPVGGDAA